MAANFMDQPSNRGQPWRALCANAEPQLDGQGLICGPWGDAIRAAVQCEKQGGAEKFNDEPAGQVLAFMQECGHDPYMEAADRTEQAAQSGPQIIGAPVQGVMDAELVGVGGGGLAGLGARLLPHGEIEVRQVNQSGCDCCACCCARWNHFPCCCCLSTSEFEIGSNGNVFLTAVEESEPWERMCCAPCHSVTVKVSDATTGEVLTTMERKGLSNCFCVCCFSCAPFCNDSMAVYDGDVQGKAGALENAPKMQTMIQQPCLGGGVIPAINIDPQAGGGQALKVRGPCIFGGCSELCCNASFKVSNENGDELANIKHMKPEDCCEMCMAIFSKMDKFRIFYQQPMGPIDKANVMLSSILVDYMFFELDEGPCYATPEKLVITCFLCNCCGCLCPCQCTLHKDGGGGDGGGDTE